MNYKDSYNKTKIKGHLQFQLIKDNKVLQSFDDHNVIVDDAGKILASIIVPAGVKQVKTGTETSTNTGYNYDGTYATASDVQYPLPGINRVALGDGILNTFTTDADKGNYIMNSNSQIDVAEQVKQHSLQHEIFRTPFNHWAFIGLDGISSEPTNQVRFTALIDANDMPADAYVVEMGLFANGTDAANTGTLFSYRLFQGWKMIEDSQLLIHWTLSF